MKYLYAFATQVGRSLLCFIGLEPRVVCTLGRQFTQFSPPYFYPGLFEEEQREKGSSRPWRRPPTFDELRLYQEQQSTEVQRILTRWSKPSYVIHREYEDPLIRMTSGR